MPVASSELDEIETLLSEGKVGPLTGFRNKMGRLFNAEIKLNEEKQPTFDFGQPKEDENAEPGGLFRARSVSGLPESAVGVRARPFVRVRKIGRAGQIV